MRPLRFTRRLAPVLALALGAACASAPAAGFGKGGTADGVSLYKRLGGYDALAAVSDDLLAGALADTAIAPFFKGLEPWQLTRIRQMLVDQLCEATGGPCKYVGKPMGLAHEQLTIDDRAWGLFAGHLVATMNKFKVPAREQQEVLEIVGSMKGDIVRKR